MISWYYVQGSERVGPVSEEALKELFLKEEINLESYVWRKGFQNWERIKDVNELNMEAPVDLPVSNLAIVEPVVEKDFEVVAEPMVQVVKQPKPKSTVQEESPEIFLNFNWNSHKEKEELFFIKIGHDRKIHSNSKYFGPYSIHELREAILENRINNHSLIFSPGMPGWIEVGETPLDPKNFSFNIENVLEGPPLLVVLGSEESPVIALMQESGLDQCTLRGIGPFKKGHIAHCSIYSGKSLKAKNLKISIVEYYPKEQKAICNILEISESAKKVMQSYGN